MSYIYHTFPLRPFSEWLALMKPDNRILTVADFCVRAKEILNLPVEKMKDALMELMEMKLIWHNALLDQNARNVIGEIADKIRKNGKY